MTDVVVLEVTIAGGVERRSLELDGEGSRLWLWTEPDGVSIEQSGHDWPICGDCGEELAGLAVGEGWSFNWLGLCCRACWWQNDGSDRPATIFACEPGPGHDSHDCAICICARQLSAEHEEDLERLRSWQSAARACRSPRALPRLEQNAGPGQCPTRERLPAQQVAGCAEILYCARCDRFLTRLEALAFRHRLRLRGSDRRSRPL